MRAVLSTRELKPEHLKSPLDELWPLPSLDLGGVQTEFWKSIDGVLKPGLELQINMVVDVGLLRPTAPEPEELSVSTADTRHEGVVSQRSAVADREAGRLTLPSGAGVVDTDEE
jgi:hypothetical protein